MHCKLGMGAPLGKTPRPLKLKPPFSSGLLLRTKMWALVFRKCTLLAPQEPATLTGVGPKSSRTLSPARNLLSVTCALKLRGSKRSTLYSMMHPRASLLVFV